ncbi:hypothetical protein SAMN04244567_02403 [Paracoccus pantotrophus]|nr:hypothetical protein SAMN04244567_02403 [Paracoccus pantotrophus]
MICYSPYKKLKSEYLELRERAGKERIIGTDCGSPTNWVKPAKRSRDVPRDRIIQAATEFLDLEGQTA